MNDEQALATARSFWGVKAVVWIDDRGYCVGLQEQWGQELFGKSDAGWEAAFEDAKRNGH